MPEAKRPLTVFLCRAHADSWWSSRRRDSTSLWKTTLSPPPYRDHARLTKDGVDAWLDKEKPLPRQDWELEIRKAVREADVWFVFQNNLIRRGFDKRK